MSKLSTRTKRTKRSRLESEQRAEGGTIPRSKKPTNTPTRPAPPVTKTEALAPIEKGFRTINYVVKKFATGDREGTLDALDEILRTGYDASLVSAQALVAVPKVDAWIEHGMVFAGRKHGALAPATLYLIRLRKKYPREPADDLYRTLRVIAQSPSNPKNPTPGECPFSAGYVNGNLELLKGGKLYPLVTFRNALSILGKRIARGEFSDV